MTLCLDCNVFCFLLVVTVLFAELTLSMVHFKIYPTLSVKYFSCFCLRYLYDVAAVKDIALL